MTATGQIPIQQFAKAMKDLEALAGRFAGIEGLDIANDAAKATRKLAERVRHDHDVYTGRKRKSPTKAEQTETITDQAERAEKANTRSRSASTRDPSRSKPKASSRKK